MTQSRKTEWQLGIEPTDDKTWFLSDDKFRQDKIGHYEAIFTLCNSYVGSRASLEYAPHYGTPGTYFAGVFDKTPKHFTEICNAPDWNGIAITLGGVALDLRKGRIREYRRILDMKKGLLFHHLRFEDDQGRITRYQSARLVHIERKHNALIWGRLTAENWSGEVVLESGLDADVYNTTAMGQVKVKHFENAECRVGRDGLLTVEASTPETRYTVALAAQTEIALHGSPDDAPAEDWRAGRGQIATVHRFRLRVGGSAEFTKTAAFATSRDREPDKVLEFARRQLRSAVKAGRGKLVDEHVREWARRWARSDVQIDGDDLAQVSLRFNLFHLMQLGSPWDDDISIGAKGLHGEGYRGHVFWDTELFMMPFFIYNDPAIARNQLIYRYKRLGAARQNANHYNLRGAKFPWESADTGLDCMPDLWGDWLTGENFNPLGHECQHHIVADVAYGVMHYVTATGDREFYEQYGARILIETAQFWSSRAEWDDQRQCHVIRNIMGPDEFHGGVNNSVYTNFIAGWNLREGLRAVEEMKRFAPARWEALKTEIGLSEDELGRWEHVSGHLAINYNDETKLFEQFDGYLQLEDHTIEYGKDGRPIIRNEWWPRFHETRLLKQADVVLLMVLFSDRFSPEQKKVNFDFYEPRTTHLSSLSPNTYATMGIEVGEYERAYRSFMMTTRVDIHEGAHVPDGIHAASTGGAWMAATSGFAGMRIQEGHLVFRPWLPPKWNGLSFRLLWQGVPLYINITRTQFEAMVLSTKGGKVRIKVMDEWREVDRHGIRVPWKR